MSNHIPDDLSIPPFLNRMSANDDKALPEISVEAYEKIDRWRDKLDQTAKLNKRNVYERAAADLFLEAEHERNLGAVQAITDAIYFLGRDHTGLCDDDIQYIMDGAKAKAEQPINDRAALGSTQGADEEPPPASSAADYGFDAGGDQARKTAGVELDVRDAGDDTEPPPPRRWLTANQFCRRFLSGLLGPGATGKTALRVLQYLSLATGRALAGQHIFRRCRVLMLSFEDDQEELQRRILAARLHHGIKAAEVKGWLFYSTPKGVKLAEMRNGARRSGALEQQLRCAIDHYRPDLLGLDPFVKLHALEENDNSAMDFVCDLLTMLAMEYDIAVDAPHHTRKGQMTPGDPEAGRGAGAAKDAGRLVYTLTTMSEDEAKQFGINPEDRVAYVRLDKAKVNLAPPARVAEWFKLVGVPLHNGNDEYPNGDEVQTVEPWDPPKLWEDLAAETLNAVLTDIDNGMQNGQRYTDAGGGKGDRAAWRVVQKHCPNKSEGQCREIIRTLIRSGVLYPSEYDDPIDHKKRNGLRRNTTKRPT